MSDDERGKKRKVPHRPRYAVACAPTPAQRLHASLRSRAESRRRALQALGISDDEGALEDVCSWPLDRVRPKAASVRRERRGEWKGQWGGVTGWWVGAGWSGMGTGWGTGAGAGVGGRRGKRRWAREKVERGGWCPEGSFEFEWESPAADALRKRKAAVARLLRRVGAVARPAPVTPPSTICSPPQPVSQLGSSSPKKPPSKAAKRSATGPNTPGKAHEANAQEDGNGKEKEKEKEKESPKKSKRKKKKKKKATLANEGNPHHIDKYRPSRLPSYQWHASVLFPPSLRFLSTRNRYPVRENEYICFPCEVALYYSHERARQRALTARYRVLARYDPRLRRRRRRGRCMARRGDGDEYDDETVDDEEYDDGDEEYDDDEGVEGDGGGGTHWSRGERCTCCLEPP